MCFAARNRLTVLSAAALLGTLPLVAQVLRERPPKPAPSALPSHTPDATVAKRKPAPLVLPKGTSLQVEVTRNYPMKDGELLKGDLLYPLYASGQLAIPKDTVV
jgi:hypothetical protein